MNAEMGFVVWGGFARGTGGTGENGREDIFL